MSEPIQETMLEGETFTIWYTQEEGETTYFIGTDHVTMHLSEEEFAELSAALVDVNSRLKNRK